ncbi:alpha-L-fucosidase [Chitinimonas koreensis]|uniref:alpha-L-fucosidase n=1 Tax=Chitinimonas koreensis TaxID=356302 RepID=UPI000424D8A7|nr:alpha-L-fucosidase [Chitinimonas koreensis]QNM98788.1 alpha-L-fucosidase [Chitinimonas koreensis]
MKLSRRNLLGLAATTLAVPRLPALAAGPIPLAPPRPHGAVPSARQLRWHALERYAFVHFSINTFTDREWGYGDESPALFDPSDFDADQIVASARAAGLRGLILTAKHHDGFCLWPSAHTAHSVRRSPWRGGRGDMVREVSDACRRQDLAFGVYLSPWDRNHAEYGRPAYLAYFRAQLRELLTNYGPLFEIWFDGANGGDGYYGGARETRQIDAPRYYDWPATWQLVRELQPDAAIWGQRGSDLRWVGNEDGHAGDPCWAAMDSGAFSIEKNHGGVRGGEVWRPAEVDVSIRPGWFWHAREDDQVKTVGRLMRIEFESVGRGAGLLLNLAPDRRGRIPERDAQVLREWGEAHAATFGRDLARGARARASQVRGNAAAYGAGRVLDGRGDTYWSCDDAVREAELMLTLPRPATFDVIRLREYLPLGQRVTTFALDVEERGGWREIARHQAIGSQRLVRLAAPVTTRRVRLRIVEAEACPAISEFALFRQPELLEPPTIARNAAGQVSLASEWPGAAIHYSLDGSTPGAGSPRYAAPFALPDGGTVKAVCLRRTKASAVASRSFDLAKAGWRIAAASAPGAEALLDEDPATLWRCPAGGELTLDLGAEHALTGFTLLPAAHLPAGHGAPLAYACHARRDDGDWQPAAQGEFANIEANAAVQTIRFDAARPARYLRLALTRAGGGQERIACAELGVLTR